ncbi:MAG TPA: efflux RND transporter permease subunit, partial [Candidatus Baltobacteraceae bacterium]|nr:efflux RND transporter permease subunit [Candidatus Baltobacteraceae bacterium]
MVRGEEPTKNVFLEWFNHRLAALTAWYQGLVPKLISRAKSMVAIFLIGLALVAGLFFITPQGFIPQEDQSLLFVIVSLPIQSSMDQTTAVVKKMESYMLGLPQVEAVTSGIGFGLANNSSNQATLFVTLKPLKQRAGIESSAVYLQYQLYTQFLKMPGVTAL